MTYAEKLKDPRWQKKRLEIMQRDGWKCCNCESSGNTLNVHHKTYINGNDPWEYPDFYLMTLCETCHKLAHYEIETLTTNENVDINFYCNIIDPIGPRVIFQKIEFYKGDYFLTLREYNNPFINLWYYSDLIIVLCRLKNFVEENNGQSMYIVDANGVKKSHNLFDFLQSYTKERTHLIGFETDKEGKI